MLQYEPSSSVNPLGEETRGFKDGVKSAGRGSTVFLRLGGQRPAGRGSTVFLRWGQRPAGRGSTVFLRLGSKTSQHCGPICRNSAGRLQCSARLQCEYREITTTPPPHTHTHTHINTTQPSPTHYQECVLKYQDSVNEKYGVLNFKEYHSEFSLKQYILQMCSASFKMNKGFFNSAAIHSSLAFHPLTRGVPGGRGGGGGRMFI